MPKKFKAAKKKQLPSRVQRLMDRTRSKPKREDVNQTIFTVMWERTIDKSSC
jgi:hypothetical protein